VSKDQLRRLLNQEVDRWAAKPFDTLATELKESVDYEVEFEGSQCQVEVMLLESREYLNVCVSVDDGSLLRATFPLNHNFIVHRDGRIER
jgi:hypothetical protein